MKKILLSSCLLLTSMLSAELQILEVPNEIGAGTRGASLGAKAIQIAALNKKSDYFKKHPVKIVQVENDCLHEENTTPFAKQIAKMKCVYERVIREVNQSVNKGFTVVLAGDHSTGAATIAGIKQAFPKKRLGVVWIDAHADIHSPYTTPSGNMHGMPLAIALSQDNQEKQINEVDEETAAQWELMKQFGGAKPNVLPSDLVYMAVRDTEPPENELLRKHHIKNYSVGEIRNTGAAKVAKDTLERLRRCDLIYVSFDVDSMDSSLSKGTGTPSKGGLTNQEAEIIIRDLLKSPKTCCLEIAEVNPLLDRENKMAEMAFEILQNATEHKR